jgi:hypothetical protein
MWRRASAWFQRREESRTRQRVIPELALEQRELGVVSGGEFASEGLTQHHTMPHNDSADLGRNLPLFAHALPCERDGLLHELPFPLGRDGHWPILLALSFRYLDCLASKILGSRNAVNRCRIGFDRLVVIQ